MSRQGTLDRVGHLPGPVEESVIPLSICLVSHAFWPFDHGGTETYVHGMARALNDVGHRAVVFHPFADAGRPDGLVESDVVEGVEVVRINRPTLLPHQEFGDETVEAALRRLLWEYRVDVTHFHHLARGLSASLIETAWLAGTRVVLTLHDAWVGCAKGKEIDLTGRQCSGPETTAKCGRCLARNDHRLTAQSVAWVTARNAYLERVLSLCDLITSPSRYQAQMVTRAPWIHRPVQVVPTGIVADVSDAVPRRLPVPAGSRRIGVMANFVFSVQGDDFKGAAVLAQATASLPAGTDPVHVFGRTDARSRSLLGAATGIVLHDAYEAARTNEILDGLDYLVVPSIIENYPTVVREAFSRGVPVISSDAGGLPEMVIDGVNGLLVPAGDPDSLAQAITRAQYEPELLGRLQAGIRAPRTMAEDAHDWAERYRILAGRTPCPSPRRISVVVSTYRRHRELVRCLQGFVDQTLSRRHFEVIVVDDDPTSPAETVAEGFRDRLDLRYIRHAVNVGLGEARRTGVGAATGDIVLFFDDDDVPGPGLLAAHARMHAAHPGETEAVLGFTAVHPDVAVTPALYHSLVVGQEYFSYPALDESGTIPWHCGWGGRTSYKASLLRKEHPRGRWLEDSDLNARLRDLGLKLHYTRSAVQYLTDGLDERRLLIRSRSLGSAAARLLALNPDPQLTALFGGSDPTARWTELAGAVSQAESIIAQLAPLGLPALRRATLDLDGVPCIAENLLHQAYSVLLGEANLGGRIVAERLAGRQTLSFAIEPDWTDLSVLRAAISVFLDAFTGDPAARAELYMCLPSTAMSPERAFAVLAEIIVQLGHDPRTVPPIKIFAYGGAEAQALDSVWLRVGRGEALAPGPAIRIYEGPDALRRAAGLQPRSQVLR